MNSKVHKSSSLDICCPKPRAMLSCFKTLMYNRCTEILSMNLNLFASNSKLNVVLVEHGIFHKNVYRNNDCDTFVLQIENIKNVTDTLSGVAMCPYSPHANATAILSRSGGLFAGAPTDFSGADSAIYRTLEYPNLRTHQYDFK